METNFNFCGVGKCTDVGRVRKANEDSMDVFDAAGMKILVVCDGMGGHVGGQVASQTAIAAIKQFMSSNVFSDPLEAINNAIITANDAILQKAQEQPQLIGMGSTCVMLVITSCGKVYFGHVGDSRIYIIANHRITQLTKDHSYVQTLVDAGEIRKEQAEHHPRKNEITNALGLPQRMHPSLCSEPIEPEAGNCFLLCSDGLSGMIPDDHIERIVSRHDMNLQARAEKLVHIANEAGGKDNITVELVEFSVSTTKTKNNHTKSTKDLNKKFDKKYLFIAGAAVVVLAVLGAGFVFYKSGFRMQKIETQNKAIENIETTPSQSDMPTPENETKDKPKTEGGLEQ